VVTFRLATAADDDALIRLILSLYREDPSPNPPTETSARVALLTLRETPAWGHAIVIEDSGTIAGYALLISFYSNELGGRVCVLDELYVAPSFRGRGIGSAFLEALARKALPVFSDAVALELEVNPENKRARALYDNAGFVPIRNQTMRRALGSSSL
jgi:GNAT superfamily N-acetyltransferase